MSFGRCFSIRLSTKNQLAPPISKKEKAPTPPIWTSFNVMNTCLMQHVEIFDPFYTYTNTKLSSKNGRKRSLKQLKNRIK